MCDLNHEVNDKYKNKMYYIRYVQNILSSSYNIH